MSYTRGVLVRHLCLFRLNKWSLLNVKVIDFFSTKSTGTISGGYGLTSWISTDLPRRPVPWESPAGDPCCRYLGYYRNVFLRYIVCKQQMQRWKGEWIAYSRLLCDELSFVLFCFHVYLPGYLGWVGYRHVSRMQLEGLGVFCWVNWGIKISIFFQPTYSHSPTNTQDTTKCTYIVSFPSVSVWPLFCKVNGFFYDVCKRGRRRTCSFRLLLNFSHSCFVAHFCFLRSSMYKRRLQAGTDISKLFAFRVVRH